MGNKVLLKRLLSFMLAIMLILPTVSEVSMAVINAAENVTGNETVYEKDGYTVVYKVAFQWEGHKAIEVTLKNTGTMRITNWELSIGNTGDITGLNRYNVFIYQESKNILLPVKSYVEDGMVMADVVETGVYCLVDMEKWLLYLEYEPSVEEPETIEENYAVTVFAVAENEKTSAGELSEPVEFNELLNSV